MNLDFFVLAPEADDSVAGNRVAASGEMIGDPWGQALDRDCLALAERARRDIPSRGARHQRLHQRLVADLLARDCDHQLVVVLDLELLERTLLRVLAELGGKALDDLVVDLAPELDRLLSLLVPDEPPDSGARLAGGDEPQPAGLWMLRFRNENLDLVAVLEHRP